MTRFAFVDHIYDSAWDALPHATEAEWFQQHFGTCNYWEQALVAAGHEARTFVSNAYRSIPAMMGEVHGYNPDVLTTMEVGRFPAHMLRSACPEAMLVAFCSHRADDDALKGFGVVWSSFDWMPDYLKSIGVNGEFMPLAFGKSALDVIKTDGERDIPVCFVGGLGSRIWKQGTATMAAIADAIPDFAWWGYIAANSIADLPPSLQRSYRGEIWGKDYLSILARTKIVVNRHGEIASLNKKCCGNNLRQYEATGCQAFLLSDAKGEFRTCITYYDAESAISEIKSCLAAPKCTSAWAEGMHRYCLEDHCYENRVPRFLEVVNSL